MAASIASFRGRLPARVRRQAQDHLRREAATTIRDGPWSVSEARVTLVNPSDGNSISPARNRHTKFTFDRWLRHENWHVGSAPRLYH